MSKAPRHIIQRADALRQELHEHDYRYYVLAEPTIADEQYDVLMKELSDIEQEYPELQTPDSPAQRVGGQPTKVFPTVTHNPPMLSLGNSYSEQEIRDFDRRVREMLGGQTPCYAAELKFDGVAIALTYRDGKFVLGATRGDGTQGDDITHNLRTIRALPLRLRTSDKQLMDIQARGEAYMERADFDRLNKHQAGTGGKIFINPRNTTAGTLKLQDPRIVARRAIRFVAYSLFSPGRRAGSHSDNLNTLRSLGFPVNEHTRRCPSIEEVLEYWKEWENKRDTLPYDIDGVVVKVDALEHQATLGTIAKSPRWAVAFKFASRKAETLLQAITLQVGRVGTITPVAELQPVFVGGSTVSRATLHNVDYITELDLRVGDTVIVEKGGDVIPKVSGVVQGKRPKRTTPFAMPESCPECGARIYRAEEEANYFCENSGCPAQVRGRIGHFAHRGAMDIEGLGEAAVEQLVGLGLIKNYADLYALHKHKDALIDIERWGEKSAQNLLDGIERSKKQPLHRVLFALGIRHVGAGVARLLAEHFVSIDVLAEASGEELQSVSGLGPGIAASVKRFFEEKHNREVIKKLKTAGLSLKAVATRARGTLSGKTFVLTGTLPTFSREEAKQIIEQLGGKIGSGISKNITYVLAGEDAGSKLAKARALGIAVITEEEFQRMIK